MKKVYVIGVALMISVLLIACDSNDENKANNEGNDAVVNNEASDNESDNSNKSGKFGDGKVLSLGETGSVETTIGDYEITFESFELLDEIDGRVPLDATDGIFVIMNATVEITGDESIESSELFSAKLFNEEGLNAGPTPSFNESIKPFEGTFEPGDTVEGQFVFNMYEGDHYELIYNHALDGVATEITWEFDADEASN